MGVLAAPGHDALMVRVLAASGLVVGAPDEPARLVAALAGHGVVPGARPLRPPWEPPPPPDGLEDRLSSFLWDSSPPLRAMRSRVSLSIEAKPRFEFVSSSLSVLMVSGAGPSALRRTTRPGEMCFARIGPP